MAKRKNARRRIIPIPNNLDEATEFVRAMGAEKRAMEHRDAELTASMDRLKAEAAAQIGQHEARLSELFEGVFVFAQGRRDALTETGKRKTVEVPSGKFGWRLPPPSVSVKSAKALIERLKNLGLTRFIRTKEDVNKEAMLAEPEVAQSVEGVKIRQEEEFFVKPDEVKVELSSTVRRLRKTTVSEPTAA